MIEQLFHSSRLKSLLWRAGAMALAAGLSSVAANLGILELSSPWITLLGLLLGEISKAMNNLYTAAPTA